jgi:hypothetical protein
LQVASSFPLPFLIVYVPKAQGKLLSLSRFSCSIEWSIKVDCAGHALGHSRRGERTGLFPTRLSKAFAVIHSEKFSINTRWPLRVPRSTGLPATALRRLPYVARRRRHLHIVDGVNDVSWVQPTEL